MIQKKNQIFHPRFALTIFVILTAILMFVGGCNAIDPGVSDYAKSTTSSGGVKAGFDDGKYVIQSTTNATDLVKGDTIAINLAHVFIRDFSEADLIRKLWDPKNLKKRGEIAIVARVKEISNKGPDFDFSSGGAAGGRLVYYSDSVHVNGHLNFSFLPIYGPIKYDGYPLAVSFYILELDQNESAGVKSLLSTLSSVGGKAYPPSSSILSVLDKVGTSLASQHKDDVNLAYHFYLQPFSASADNSLGQPLLKTANYALIKQDYVYSASARSGIPFHWKIEVDPKTGLIHSKGESVAEKSHFTEATYLTFQINKGQNADNLNQAERFAQFGNFIESIKGTEFMDFSSLGTDLTSMLKRDEAQQRSQDVLIDLKQIKDSKKPEDEVLRAKLLGKLKLFLTETATTSENHLREADRKALLISITKLYKPDRLSPLLPEEIDQLK